MLIFKILRPQPGECLIGPIFRRTLKTSSMRSEQSTCQRFEPCERYNEKQLANNQYEQR
jgi:hypothetical protein